MRLLADENCERVVVEALREQGHDVIWSAEAFPAAEDEFVYAEACRLHRVLLTSDRDFGFLMRAETENPTGVMLMRLGRLKAESRVTRMIEVAATNSEPAPGQILVVEPGMTRMRQYGGLL